MDISGNRRNSGGGPQEIALLQRIRKEDLAWQDLARRYGVTNPDLPWKTWMYATCEALADAGRLDPVERRHEDDALAERHYRDVPQPERQLLALVHALIGRGLIDQEELARRMEMTRSRLVES
jgi:Nitrile hydratase beta subunit, N-terminal